MKSFIGLFAVFSLSAVFSTAGCAHKSAGDITGQFAAFNRTRDGAVQNSAAAKGSLDAVSLNQMNICYTDLRSKASQYADHVVAVIQSGSFDTGRNQTDQQQLQTSIASYNDCVLKLQKAASVKSSAPATSLLSADWVPAFGRAVDSYWTRDGSLVQALSPDAKAKIIEQIRTMTAWPDFASIGGGTPAPPP